MTQLLTVANRHRGIVKTVIRPSIDSMLAFMAVFSSSSLCVCVCVSALTVEEVNSRFTLPFGRH